MNCAQAFERHGSKAAAARALKIPVSTFKDRLRAERKSFPRIDVRGAREIDDTLPSHAQRGMQSRHRQWYERNNRVLHDDGKLLELERLPETVLHFSCTQSPFEHADTLPFLSMVKASYAPDLVICHGDELDLQFLKKAFMNADSDGPVRELEKGREFVAQLGRIFPQMLLLTSNHIHTRMRYAQSQGNIPTIMMRDWRDVIDAPGDWAWRDYIIARNWLWEHGHDIGKASRGNIVEETVKRFGRPLSVMRGHIHSEHGDLMKPIWIEPARQIRAFHVACLMDRHKVGYTRAPTVNGAAITYRGVPMPIPMPKDKFDRWTGRLAEW